MRFLMFAFVAVLFGLTSGALAATPEKNEKIIELLKVTNGVGMLDEAGEIVLPAIVTALKEALPELEDQDFNVISEVLKDEVSAHRGQYLSLLYAVYDKHYTLAELEASIAFYSSPAGQSIVKKSPLIGVETKQLSRKWGQEMAKNVLEKVFEKARELGYKI